MSTDRLTVLARVCLGAAASRAGAAGARPPPPVKAGLADVTFMAGHWVGVTRESCRKRSGRLPRATR